MTDMTEEESKPFDKSYVMRITVANARKSADISINKTSQRLEEFAPKTDKWQEILDTLHALHQFRKLVDDFQYHNPQLFMKDSNDG